MSGDKIIRGLTEAIDFARGNAAGVKVRQVKVPESVDVHAIRGKLKLSQREFALRFGFPLATVRNWEQGHRAPEGATRLLLKIIDESPEVVERALATG